MPVRVTRVYTNLVGSWNDVTEEKSTVIAHSNLNNVLNEDGTVCTKIHVYTDAAWDTVQREVVRGGGNKYVEVIESDPEYLDYYDYFNEPDWYDEEEKLIGTMESLEQERLNIERNNK